MSKIKIEAEICIINESVDIHLHLSGEIDVDLKSYGEQGDHNEPGEDDDPDGLNWPPTNYN